MKEQKQFLAITAVVVLVGLLFLTDKGWSDYTTDRDNHRNMQEQK